MTVIYIFFWPDYYSYQFVLGLNWYVFFYVDFRIQFVCSRTNKIVEDLTLLKEENIEQLAPSGVKAIYGCGNGPITARTIWEQEENVKGRREGKAT